MKIVFICNSLEPGKDGIGDYTLKISLECLKHGELPVIIACNDKFILEKEDSVFCGIPIYRIPISYSRKQKENEIKFILKQQTPVDWISLQFVSYGLNKRGILATQISLFRKIVDGFKVHVMIHELWVGEELQASLQRRLLGKIQKAFIIKFIKAINPKVIHTSIPLYKKMLERGSIDASILPLFSNIENKHHEKTDFISELPSLFLGNNDNLIVYCTFGSIYYDSWDIASLLKKLTEEVITTGNEIAVVSIGKISYGKEFWDNLPATYPNIRFVTLGQQSEDFISYWLNNFVDFGIITTPAIIAGKSGSYMAFLEHGIPVFCNKNKLTFNFKVSDDLIDDKLIQVDENYKFKMLPRFKPSSQFKNSVKSLIKTFNSFR